MCYTQYLQPSGTSRREGAVAIRSCTCVQVAGDFGAALLSLLCPSLVSDRVKHLHFERALNHGPVTTRTEPVSARDGRHASGLACRPCLGGWPSDAAVVALHHARRVLGSVKMREGMREGMPEGTSAELMLFWVKTGYSPA